MPGFEILEDKIKKELKKYNDEDMIWIYDIILKINSDNRNKIQWRDKRKFANFNQLKDLIIYELLEGESEDKVEFGFQAIKNGEKKFIKNEIFNNFKNDSRLCLFTLSFLDKETSDEEELPIKYSNLVNVSPRANLAKAPLSKNKKFNFFSKKYIYINFIFNIFYNETSEKKLIKIKQEYENKFKKGINSSSKFNDPNFIIWSYDYLMSRKSDFKRASKSCFDDNDSKLFIISYLDFLYLNDHQEHETLTMRMSKAWSQKKFRDSDKVKTNYHLPLTKDCKDKLKRLSELMDISENKLLERLINEKYNLEATDENGKFKF